MIALDTRLILVAVFLLFGCQKSDRSKTNCLPEALKLKFGTHACLGVTLKELKEIDPGIAPGSESNVWVTWGKIDDLNFQRQYQFENDGLAHVKISYGASFGLRDGLIFEKHVAADSLMLDALKGADVHIQRYLVPKEKPSTLVIDIAAN